MIKPSLQIREGGCYKQNLSTTGMILVAQSFAKGEGDNQEEFIERYR